LGIKVFLLLLMFWEADGNPECALNPQPSTISLQPSIISPQSTTISHQPSAISHQPSKVTNLVPCIET
jgi:hypothetical protein